MAEYGARAAEFAAAGVALAALSTDPPGRAAALIRELRLEFPLICDQERTVIRAWGLLTPALGGQARPATFWLGPDRHVRLAALESRTNRVGPDALLAQIRGAGGASPEMRRLGEGPRELWRAFRLWRRR